MLTVRPAKFNCFPPKNKMWCPTHKTLYGETKYFIFDATNQIVSTDSPPSLRRFIILVSIIYGCEASVPIVPNINSCHVRIINFQSEPQKIYLKLSGVDASNFFFFLRKIRTIRVILRRKTSQIWRRISWNILVESNLKYYRRQRR